MNQIFFTSDSHFGHKNICRGTSTWEHVGDGGSHQALRDFDTIEQMNDRLVEDINSTVDENDILYHLGDWSFGGIANIWEFRKRINCKNIHLILGNHDHHIENNKILPNAMNVYRHGVVDIEDSHTDFDENTRAKELFASVGYVKVVRTAKIRLFLSHYAHRVWDKSHRGQIHLYGHSHGSLENEQWGKSMDVGVDSRCLQHGDYKPYSLNEILNIMAQREAKIIDHHNAHTN